MKKKSTMKLSKPKLSEIRKLYQKGVSVEKLAKKYKVGKTTIYRYM